jgi:uncharacterized protein (TIGR03437 family)
MLRSRAHLLIEFLVVPLIFCGVSFAQDVETATKPGPKLALARTVYAIQPGEAIALEAPAETLDFIQKATHRSASVDGAEKWIVVGPNSEATRVLIAASLLTPPGEYAVVVRASDGKSDERSAVVSLLVSALPTVPLNATRPPVILVNGWQFGFNSNSGDFGTCPISSGPTDAFGINVLQNLASAPRTYFFDNCVEGKDQLIEDLAGKLGEVINKIQYDNHAPVPQIDLIVHSMGGLIVRSYLAGLQVNGSLLPPPVHRIRKAVFIATPHFGSFKAKSLASVGSQTAEMIPASGFLWALAMWNQGIDDLRGVDALAIIGNKGTASSSDGITWTNASDGVVSVTSASLNFARDSVRTRILPYCHADSTGFFIDCSGGPIAQASETWAAIASFLADTSDWMSIGLAATAAMVPPSGIYVGVQSASGEYVKDLNSVRFNGTPLAQNPYYVLWSGEFLPAGLGTVQFSSSPQGNLQAQRAASSGTYTPFRVKLGSFISSVTPLLSSPAGLVVPSGGKITLAGYGFGSRCSSCNLWAGAVLLTEVTSWTDTSITASLPAAIKGLIRIQVQTATGFDSINIMAEAPPLISLSSTQLTFTSTLGGAVPPQTVTVSNVGSGTFSWTAATTASWLTLSTATGLLTVSATPTGLAPGTYTGTIFVTAVGVSNSPQTILATLTVTPGQLLLGSSAVSFTASGALSVNQSISVSVGNSVVPFTALVIGATPWMTVTPASGSTPANIVVTVNSTGLAAGSYTGQIKVSSSFAANSPVLTVNLTVPSVFLGPAVTSVLNGASFLSGIQNNSWITIKGTNFTANSRAWNAAQEIVNGVLPTSLDGVRVTVNGKPAVVYFVSPTQINALAPADPTIGPVQVAVTNTNGTSSPYSAQLQRYAPGFFTFDVQGGRYPAAVNGDGSYLGPPGLFGAVLQTKPAKPGSTILLFGTGFGPTNPPVPADRVFSGAAPITDPVNITIGNQTAQVLFAGLSSNGLYQFNVVVPNLPNGEHEIVAAISGVRTQPNIVVSVGN